jgi:hypothetical protein
MFMSRPRRNPALPTTKLTVYVTAETHQRMKDAAGARSVGALLDEMFDPTLKANFDFTGPLSALPEVPRPTEAAHIGSTVKRPPVPIARRHEKVDSGSMGKVCRVCKATKAQMEKNPNCPGDAE